MVRVAVALALCLALMEVGAEDKFTLFKCCGVNEVLDVKAMACVRAPWPRYTHEDISRHAIQYVRMDVVFRPPLNESWLRRWVPPGLPLGAVDLARVGSTSLIRYARRTRRPVSVNTSALATDAIGDDWRDDRALFTSFYMLRRRHDGYIKTVLYCVDAATQPFPAPFALLLLPDCSYMHDCVDACCHSGKVLTKSAEGSLRCESNRSVSLTDDALQRAFGPEVANSYINSGRVQTPSSVHRLSAHAVDRSLTAPYIESFFSTTESCVGFLIGGDGRPELVTLHHEFPRWGRAFYRMTRPLSCVSSLLLLAALVAIGTSPRLRTNVHGWTLGCHAGCLLAFNLLQVAYNLSLSDCRGVWVLNDYRRKCIAMGLFAYFFLTAANCWLTALCFNMGRGFRATRVTLTGGHMRRFLKLSAFAWGISVVLTAACTYTFLNFWATATYDWTVAPWYIPSLMETRTCFDEAPVFKGNIVWAGRQWGSGLFYYAPMLALSAVNVVCVARTALRVRFLARGNSVLRRDARERRSKEGHTRGEATAPQRSVSPKETQHIGCSSAPRRVSVYIRLLLSGGSLELIVEMILWATTRLELGDESARDIKYEDHTLSYRAVCFLTDLARAAVVLWLAAPEAGELRAFCRRLRRTCGKILFRK